VFVAYGVANQILTLFEDAGISREKAKKNFYFVDSKGTFQYSALI
jgi:hypothetical protein